MSKTKENAMDPYAAINETVARVNSLAKGMGLEGGLQTITAETLKSSESSIAPVQSTPATQNAALQGFFEATPSGLGQKATETAKTADTAFDELINSLTSTPSESALKAQAYDKSGVDDLSMELSGLDDQIRKEQRALENQKRAIADAGGGLASGQQIEIQRIEGESLRRQADLYIIREGLQGKYDSAKAIADRAVDAQFEADEKKNEALRLTYNRYQGLFDKDEQRAFEAAQSERETALGDEKTLKKDVYDLALEAMQNGAPSSVARAVMQATTREDAVAAAGQYIGLLDRQREARLAGEGDVPIAVKLTPDDQRTLTGAGFTPQDITDLQKSVNDFGIDAVLETITDERQKNALRKVYGVQQQVTRAQIETTVTLKAAQDALKDTYTDNELKALAKEKGYTKWFGLKSDIEGFLNSDDAKQLYIDLLADQYRAGGLYAE